MSLQININQSILPQFAQYLGLDDQGGFWDFNNHLGRGVLRPIYFPGTLSCFHLTYCLQEEIQLCSNNPIDSDYFLLNINLSEQQTAKTINQEEFLFQKYLPTGILFYPRNIEIYSKGTINQNFEIVLIKLHKSFVPDYFGKELDFILEIENTIVYEDLDAPSEKLLKKVLTAENKIKAHAFLLSFLAIFFAKLDNRDRKSAYENIHADDVKNLFLAAAVIRNPILAELPTVDHLAQLAKMGKTKFKTTFKQVFGCPPMQYHQKIKMNYAWEVLQSKTQTIAELAYELGYAHPSKFTRAFKKHFQCLPSEVGQNDFLGN